MTSWAVRLVAPRAWPGFARALPAAGLGMLAAVGQEPLGWWWLSLPGLCGLIWLVTRQTRAASAAWLALWGGAGYFALALSWIVEPFLIDIERHGWMAPFALLFMAFGLALFWAVPAALTLRVAAPAGRRALIFATLLSLAEGMRGVVLTGFPWADPGHIWIGTPALQIAAMTGPAGLTMLSLFVAALPVALPVWRGLAVSAVLIAAVMGLGQWRLAQPMPEPARDIVVRLLQPNAPQQEKWLAERALVFYDRLLAYTGAKSERAPDLIVWPETALPYLLNHSGDALREISDVAGGVPVAVGVQRTEGLRGFNSLAMIGAGGTVDAVYDKFHLVPFGEYIPFGDLMADLFGITAFASRLGAGYSPGPGAVVLNLGELGKVLPLICYEAIFPQDLRAAPERPDWVLQVTNDAWFGSVSGPYQHLAQARLRAVEQGLAVLRSANTGISAIIDARGQVIQSLALNSKGMIEGAVPAALPETIYAKYGDWSMRLVLLGILSALVLSRRRKSD